jgi:beta-barrel assembly-enhancing protease
VWRLRRWSVVIGSMLVCAACAGPVSRLPELPKDEVEAEHRLEQIAQIRDYYAQLRQVDTVAFGIRTANKADCKDWVSAQIGLYAVTPQSLPHKYRSFVREALDLTWARPTVISVVEGSPAAQAGIVKGDEIIALNGELIPVTGTVGWMAGWLKHNGVAPVRVNLRNNSIDRTVTVTPVMGCAIPIAYVIADEVNAETDGRKIIISSSITRMARTEAQLALVVGHELAHANLGHIQKQRLNSVLGFVGGAVVDTSFLAGGISTGGVFTREFQKAGARVYSVAFEREADYVGAYYAARAGYDLAGAEEVWRSLSLLSPDSIRFGKTHPTTPVRFVQMQKVAAEIADKQRRHLPLEPELRFANADAQPPMNSGEGIH